LDFLVLVTETHATVRATRSLPNVEVVQGDVRSVGALRIRQPIGRRFRRQSAARGSTTTTAVADASVAAADRLLRDHYERLRAEVIATVRALVSRSLLLSWLDTHTDMGAGARRAC